MSAEHSISRKHALWVYKAVYSRLECKFAENHQNPEIIVQRVTPHQDNFLDNYNITYTCTRTATRDILVKIEFLVTNQTAVKVLSQLTPAFFSLCGEAIECDRIPEYPQTSLRERRLSVGHSNFDAYGKLCYECKPVDIVIDVNYNLWFMFERNPAVGHYGEPAKWRLDKPSVQIVDTNTVLDACTMVAGISQYEPASNKRIRLQPSSSAFDQKECSSRQGSSPH